MREPGADQFALHVEPHLEALFRMAWRLLRNTPDAQDLVQDTCLIACRRLTEIAAVDSPRRWLLTVLHNQFIDGARRRQRSPVVNDDQDEIALLASDDFDPEELLRQSQDEQSLQRAFLQLNAMQRTLLSLLAEGYKLPEIESITGIERKVLSARLNRARTALARRLIDQKRAVQRRHTGSQS